MTAISVCCDKSVFRTYQDCPDHNPSKEDLRCLLSKCEEGLREIASYLGPTISECPDCEGAQVEMQMSLEIANKLLSEISKVKR